MGISTSQLAGQGASIEKLAAALTELPWGVHLVVASGLIAGLVLWSSGRNVLKPVMVFVAAMAGGLGGFLAVPTLLPEAGVSPWVGAVGGAAIGLLAGLLLYRLVLMVAFGVSMSAAFGLVAAAGISLATGSAITVAMVIALSPQTMLVAPPETGESSMPSATWDDGPAGEQKGPDKPASAIPASDPTDGLPGIAEITADPMDAAARAREFVTVLRARAENSWRALSAAQQLIIGACGLAGLIIGGLVGLTLPQWAAGALTAFVGAAVWLPAAVWLLHASQMQLGHALELPAAGWLVVWGVVSVLGVAVQWAGLMKSKKKSKKTREKE